MCFSAIFFSCAIVLEKMVLPQKNGFSVIYNQILPSVKYDKKEALIRASAAWGNFSRAEQDRRDKVAREIWQKSNARKEAAKSQTVDDEGQPPKKAPKLSE